LPSVSACSQGDALVQALAAQGGDRLGQRVLAVQFDVAVGVQQQEPHAGQLAGEELEEQQRGRVRPVQIVQRDHQGLPGCRILEKVGDAVEPICRRSVSGSWAAAWARTTCTQGQ